MFTDIVGFTRLSAENEAQAIELIQWQRKTIKPLVVKHEGQWLKEIGDGLLLSFPSSLNAVECAVQIQENFNDSNFKIRIGIHQGDVIIEGNDIFGDGVNLASRIESAAPKGGIAYSDKVQQDISAYPEFDVISMGEQNLKGIKEPVKIYCLAPYGLPEIPEYKILQRTGAGAYGEVWLAQAITGIHRAIKIVHRDRFDNAIPYEREFNGIKKYEPVSRKNEGLIDLLHVGLGKENDFFYYVMELADDQRMSGQVNKADYKPKTFQSELEARGRLTVEECLKYGAHLARSLAYLHDQNLVHRDVKPSNIVYVNGIPKLADIGLITNRDNSSTLVGTIGYIPPEGPGKPSSDLYALGIVLYELSTGKDRAEFPEIDLLDPALKGLNQFFLKACSNDLNERFKDGHEMARHLDTLANNPIEKSKEKISLNSSFKLKALTASLLIIFFLIFKLTNKESQVDENTRAITKSDGNAKKFQTPDPTTNLVKTSSPTTNPVDLTPPESGFLEKGLVAYYPFNGNAKDESGNGKDGSPKGDPALISDRKGNASQAYNFDGVDDFISIKSAQTGFSDGSKDRAISVWLKVAEKQKHAIGLVWAAGTPNPGRAIALGLHQNAATQGKLLFGMDPHGGPNLPMKELNILDGKWHHLVWSSSDQTADTYVDGIKIDSREFKLNTISKDAFIGGHPTYRQHVASSLDDIRIYNRALSAEEVSALYHLEKPKPLEWDFTHHYDNVMDPAADSYLHSAVNAIKYAENAGNACYWAPEVPGKEARVTYKYSFKGPTKRAWLDAILWSYNFGEARFGKGSIWASKDGEKWIQIIDAPTPDGKDAPYHVREHLPQAVLGGQELWIQTRMQTEGLNILSQFSRYGLRDVSGKVYSLHINLEPENKPDLTKGLIAYYPFNGNAKDESGNGNDGKLHNAKPTKDKSGNEDSAISCDESGSFIEYPKFNLTGDKTFSIWSKIGQEGTAAETYLIGQNSGQNRWHAHAFTGDNVIHAFQKINGVDNHPYSLKSTDVASGSWVYYTFVMHEQKGTETGHVTVYVNSKKVGVVSTKEIGEMDGPYYSNKAHNELSGKAAFDNLRIYDRALSEEQIKALYEWEKIPSNPQ